MLTRSRQRRYQQLLELYRARLSRSDVGLPPLPARGGPRPAGLAMHEVDAILPASPGYYEKVKSGALRPSSASLLLLMEVLRFSAHHARVAHLDLFGTEPALPATGSPSSHWSAVVEAQREMACVLAPGGHITAWNRPFATMFPEGRVPVNWWRWALSASARNVLTEWETRWAAPLMADLELLSYRHPDDAALRGLHERTLADPRLQQIPEADTGLDDEARPLQHPTRGQGMARVMTAHTPDACVLTVLFEAAA